MLEPDLVGWKDEFSSMLGILPKYLACSRKFLCCLIITSYMYRRSRLTRKELLLSPIKLSRFVGPFGSVTFVLIVGVQMI